MGYRSALFAYEKDPPSGWVVIRDGWYEGCGKLTVTNDAEDVVEAVLTKHPDCRIAYYDTENVLSELTHEDGAFTGFSVLSIPLTAEFWDRK